MSVFTESHSLLEWQAVIFTGNSGFLTDYRNECNGQVAERLKAHAWKACIRS